MLEAYWKHELLGLRFPPPSHFSITLLDRPHLGVEQRELLKAVPACGWISEWDAPSA